MNKLKEFLWFLIPFLCLSVISVLYFILTTENGASYIMSNIGDPFFVIIEIIFPFILAMTFSLVSIIIYRVLLYCVFKKKITYKKIYIFTFLISIITTVLMFLLYSSSFNIVSDCIFSLQVGIISTFICWVTDLIKDKISKNKTEQK